MPYNTRRKSLSLPSLGIHVPMTHAARAAAAAASKASRSSATASSASSLEAGSEATEAHPSKRQKRSHSDDVAIEQTPPPSPSPDSIVDMTDDSQPLDIDLKGINDDIVEAVIAQLQSTANRPHLIKELATVLSQRLASVQHSANPCAIISSRLASYMKRPCWSAPSPCPLAKELEAIHPRRTYYFLTVCPRQPLLHSSSVMPSRESIVTPSVSLTDDSGSDDVDARRRELSPSPEVDLSPHQFEDCEDDFAVHTAPLGSLPSHRQPMPHRRDSRHNSPPLEKDEREFTHTADVLQKRKLTEAKAVSDGLDRNGAAEYGYRDEFWFGEHRIFGSTALIASPAMKPIGLSWGPSSSRKDEEHDNWLKLNKLMEWGQGAESIEIDELDGLLDAC